MVLNVLKAHIYINSRVYIDYGYFIPFPTILTSLPLFPNLSKLLWALKYAQLFLASMPLFVLINRFVGHSI